MHDRSPRKLCQTDSNCCAVFQTLVDLDDQLAKTRSLLASLESQREALQLRIDLNRSHPSIVDRLPEELASEIFFHVVHPLQCQTQPTFPTPNLKHSRAVFAVRLGAVCQNWRRIAWSSPRLWSSLIIDSSHSYVTDMRIELVKEWIDRSGRLPLSIAWHQPSLVIQEGFALFFNDKNAESLIDIMNRHADRWESLDLHLPSRALCLFDASKVSNLSSLRELALNILPDRPLTITNFYNLTPPIVDLTFIGNWRWDIKVLDWKRVTRLTASLPGTHDVLRILSEGQYLQECKIHLTDSKLDLSSTSSFPTARFLRSLEIRFPGRDSMDLFMNSTTLPALTHLHLQASSIILSVPNFVSFLARSSSPLTSLNLTCAGLTQEGFVPIARLIPSLRKLSIILDGRDEGNFRPFYLAWACPNPVALLPLLVEFSWVGCTPFPWVLLPYYLGPITRTRCRPLKLINIRCILSSSDHKFPKISNILLSQLLCYRGVVQIHLNVHFDEITRNILNTRVQARASHGDGGSRAYLTIW